MNKIKDYFNQLRFNKNHHLGLGDIRLTITQQDELVALFEQKTNNNLQPAFDYLMSRIKQQMMYPDMFEKHIKEKFNL